MNKALLLALALIVIPPVSVEAQQDIDELVRQGNVYFKRGLIRRNNLTPRTQVKRSGTMKTKVVYVSGVV